jgi:recombination protein RecA
VIDLGQAAGLVKRSGTWFSVGEQQLGQGRTAACQWLAEHPEVRDQLALMIAEKARRAAQGKLDVHGEAQPPARPQATKAA